MRSLFIVNRMDLDTSPAGGVQICSKEFLDLVQSISSEVIIFPVSVDRSITLRVARRSGLVPYALYAPEKYVAQISEILSAGIDAVFLNKAELLRFVPILRKLSSTVPIVVLSHGNESGDLLLEKFVYRKSPGIFARYIREFSFGRLMAFEAEIRAKHDFKVCTLSAEEQVIERWLGCRDTFYLPRRIRCDFLDWDPVERRLGYIGTLSHTPNLVALCAVLDEIERSSIKATVEIIGGPVSIGFDLAARYTCVVYHGTLSNHDCRGVAANWSLAINPIFWLSRGASMKLAQLLAWGLPTLTTSSGKRGYEVPQDVVIECQDNATSFVQQISSCLATPEILTSTHNALVKEICLIEAYDTSILKFRNWIGCV